jgi:hypothetical protein
MLLFERPCGSSAPSCCIRVNITSNARVKSTPSAGLRGDMRTQAACRNAGLLVKGGRVTVPSELAGEIKGKGHLA